ncbi:peptidylprolyl isomerase [candidate division WOR-3 bacterium]|nr:peptidylprolyl isomerase [candidate division WOR-3 bacterium]
MSLKIRVSLSFLALIGIILFPGCKKEEKGEIVARVGKTTLTVEELLTQIPPQMLINTSPETRKMILDNWVSNELIYQDALKKGFENRPEVEKQLEQVKRGVITQAYVQEMLANSRFIPENEARAYFEEHEEDYNTVIEVSHISLNSQEKGVEVLRKLKEGQSFATLARRYSTDSATAKKRGSFGSFRKGDLVKLPTFEQIAFSLKKSGDMTPVVQTEFGYDIIKLLSRKKSPQRVEYKDVAELIMQKLRQERFRIRSEAIIDSLKKTYDQEVYPGVLEKELGIYSPGAPSLPSETTQ